MPTHRLRNGHLNQIAYSLYLFIRHVADGDLVGWIDNRLDQAYDQASPDRLTRAGNALIEPLRNVYGVSDKVLAMALSGILIGAADVRPNWLQVGVQQCGGVVEAKSSQRLTLSKQFGLHPAARASPS